MPGTIGGAFVVDYLGPKYTMVRFSSTDHLLTSLNGLGILEDHRSGAAGHHWLHHEWSLCPAEEAHRGLCCGLWDFPDLW